MIRFNFYEIIFWRVRGKVQCDQLEKPSPAPDWETTKTETTQNQNQHQRLSDSPESAPTRAARRTSTSSRDSGTRTDPRVSSHRPRLHEAFHSEFILHVNTHVFLLFGVKLVKCFLFHVCERLGGGSDWTETTTDLRLCEENTNFSCS
ncbi:hypothetical protein NL108_016757 [Boleophthalmus pectinirostris]|nr:hypothetical protein NL108_016757 [Boleophthalmus pectinirostris]